MSKVDYYEVLGLTKKATQIEVKQAYKQLALVLFSLSRNIILTKIKINKKPKLNLHKYLRHIQVYFSLLKVLNDTKKRDNYDKYGCA
jgi:preprotein translocase subunit Sec63